MNISEHIRFFEQEMTRRNFSNQTVEIYSSCLKKFFGQSQKDHPKNINENDIREFLSKFTTPNTQRGYHSAIKKLLGHSNIKTTNVYLHVSHNHISKIQSPLNSISL